MRKIILMLCMFFVAITLSACGFFGPQRYVCDEAEVESIQIVRLDKYVEGEYRYEYTVLSEISDRFAFIERLNNLKHSVNWGEPRQLNIEYIVIKINFLNGDYDLLYHRAQWFNRDNVNNYGYFFFNKEEFDSLISDYLTE